MLPYRQSEASDLSLARAAFVYVNKDFCGNTFAGFPAEVFIVIDLSLLTY